jgi:hypothetical protein
VVDPPPNPQAASAAEESRLSACVAELRLSVVPLLHVTTDGDLCLALPRFRLAGEEGEKGRMGLPEAGARPAARGCQWPWRGEGEAAPAPVLSREQGRALLLARVAAGVELRMRRGGRHPVSAPQPRPAPPRGAAAVLRPAPAREEEPLLRVWG